MQERERGWGEESVSRRHIILLPNGPAFSSAVWSPSSISDALFEDLGGVHAGVQRSTSESGRHITLDGDELCAQGRGCVCDVCCLCVCVSDIERNQTYGENVCVCDGKLHAK